MTKQQFDIGDKVVSKNDLRNEVREVLGIFLDARGITYKVSSKELDFYTKEVINGVSFYKQEELEKAKDEITK